MVDYWRLNSVEEMPVPYVDSMKVKCADCGKELWLCKHCYKNSPERIPLCHDCADKKAKELTK